MLLRDNNDLGKVNILTSIVSGDRAAARSEAARGGVDVWSEIWPRSSYLSLHLEAAVQQFSSNCLPSKLNLSDKSA
jgi:hypothetical protein